MDILFIGNSFTYYNEMPEILNSLSAAACADIHAERLTYGGYYLTWYTDPENPHGNEAVPLIESRHFDHIVLQEQSAAPAIENEVFSEGVSKLMPHIKASGARPVFYKTWAYGRESAKLSDIGMGYEEMLFRLTAAYDAEAEKYGAGAVPVGGRFFRLMEDHPVLDLYKEDAYHPNLCGSYLAACLFFKYFTGQNPPDSWLPERLDPGYAKILRGYV